jgi:hypothetical protein
MTKLKAALLATAMAAVAIAMLAPMATSSSTATGEVVVARRGADDGAGDDRGRRGRGADDGAGHTQLDNLADVIVVARRGADDPAGDDRGRRGRQGRGRGADDAIGHA